MMLGLRTILGGTAKRVGSYCQICSPTVSVHYAEKDLWVISASSSSSRNSVISPSAQRCFSQSSRSNGPKRSSFQQVKKQNKPNPTVQAAKSQGYESTTEKAEELAKQLERRLRNWEIPTNFLLRFVKDGRMAAETTIDQLMKSPDFDPETTFFELHNTKTDVKIVKLIDKAQEAASAARAALAAEEKLQAAKQKPPSLRSVTDAGFNNDGKTTNIYAYATAQHNDRKIALQPLYQKMKKAHKVSIQLAVKTGGPRERRIQWSNEMIQEYKEMADKVFEDVSAGEGVLTFLPGSTRGLKEDEQPIPIPLLSYTPSKEVCKAYIKEQMDEAKLMQTLKEEKKKFSGKAVGR